MQSTLCASLVLSSSELACGGGAYGSPNSTHQMITRSSPSPWSKFLSPSLFTGSGRISPIASSAVATQLPQPQPQQTHRDGGAQGDQVQAIPPAVGPLAAPGFTHEREINPFEKSFATNDVGSNPFNTRPGSPSPTTSVARRHNKRSADPSPMGRPTSRLSQSHAAAAAESSTSTVAPRMRSAAAIRAPNPTNGTTFNSNASADSSTSPATRPRLTLGLAARRLNKSSLKQQRQQQQPQPGQDDAELDATTTGGASNVASFTSSTSSGSGSGNASDRTSSTSGLDANDSPASSIAASPSSIEDGLKSNVKPVEARRSSSSAAHEASSSLARLVSTVPTAANRSFQHYQAAPLPISYGAPLPSLTSSWQAATTQAPSMRPNASTSYLDEAHDQYNHDFSAMTGVIDAAYTSFEYSGAVPSLAPTAFSGAASAPVAESSTTSSHNSPAPSATAPAPRKRGRKPKSAVPEEDTEAVKFQALERNRVAASKSRRRKKERVSALEQGAVDLANSNTRLQQMCHALQVELAGLRKMLTQIHPLECDCVHVRGYCAREVAGGGIPTIERIAGNTLALDYTKVPRWGSEDDCYCAPPAPVTRAKRAGPAAEPDFVDERRAIPIKRTRT